MAIGFGVGAFLFAFGTILVWLEAAALTANVVFAVGAVCFTAAAFVQWATAEGRVDRGWRSRFANADWLASAVQLAGTLFFNVMTVRAVVLTLGSARIDETVVWGPDFWGSALFLVSSWIAWHPVARRLRHDLLRGRSASICAANMMGSVLFGLSAWGAMPVGDSVRSVAASNWGTFLGALCFLVGAVLTWPPNSTHRRSAHTHTNHGKQAR